jgi:hypothetical protein
MLRCYSSASRIRYSCSVQAQTDALRQHVQSPEHRAIVRMRQRANNVDALAIRPVPPPSLN